MSLIQVTEGGNLGGLVWRGVSRGTHDGRGALDLGAFFSPSNESSFGFRARLELKSETKGVIPRVYRVYRVCRVCGAQGA